MIYGYDVMFGLWSVLLWVILLSVIVKVIYLFVRTARHGGTDEYILDILKTRYAKGELTKEEFDQKKKDLGL
jgi:putative membrane protein